MKWFLIMFLALSMSGCWRTRGDWNVKERTIADGEYRIQNYEWFHNQYAKIKSMSSSIKVMSNENEREGTILVLIDMIGEYNARSKMSWSREQWKDPILPFEINEEEFIVSTKIPGL
jgi:hypothetical protein